MGGLPSVRQRKQQNQTRADNVQTPKVSYRATRAQWRRRPVDESSRRCGDNVGFQLKTSLNGRLLASLYWNSTCRCNVRWVLIMVSSRVMRYNYIKSECIVSPKFQDWTFCKKKKKKKLAVQKDDPTAYLDSSQFMWTEMLSSNSKTQQVILSLLLYNSII